MQSQQYIDRQQILNLVYATNGNSIEMDLVIQLLDQVESQRDSFYFIQINQNQFTFDDFFFVLDQAKTFIRDKIVLAQQILQNSKQELSDLQLFRKSIENNIVILNLKLNNNFVIDEFKVRLELGQRAFYESSMQPSYDLNFVIKKKILITNLSDKLFFTFQPLKEQFLSLNQIELPLYLLKLNKQSQESFVIQSEYTMVEFQLTYSINIGNQSGLDEQCETEIQVVWDRVALLDEDVKEWTDQVTQLNSIDKQQLLRGKQVNQNQNLVSEEKMISEIRSQKSDPDGKSSLYSIRLPTYYGIPLKVRRSTMQQIQQMQFQTQNSVMQHHTDENSMIDMILLLMIITISLNSYYYSEILNLTLMMYIKIQYFMVKIGEWKPRLTFLICISMCIDILQVNGIEIQMVGCILKILIGLGKFSLLFLLIRDQNIII